MLLRRELENAQTTDARHIRLGRPGVSVLAGAALLAVGVAGFAATARYDHADFGFAPLEPVAPLSVREQALPDFGSLVANLGPVTLPLQNAEAAEEFLAEAVTESAVQLDKPNHVVAAGANTVTILPAATPTAPAAVPSASPMAVASPSPTPTALPTLPPSPAIRGDGADAPAIRATTGSSNTLADFYGATGEAGEAPQINQGPTVSQTLAPRAIDPTRPMPR